MNEQSSKGALPYVHGTVPAEPGEWIPLDLYDEVAIENTQLLDSGEDAVQFHPGVGTSCEESLHGTDNQCEQSAPTDYPPHLQKRSSNESQNQE